MQHPSEPILVEVGLELFTSIVVIDSVGEPYAFNIGIERAKVFRLMVNGQVRINHLQHLTYAQVVPAELVEGDVTPIQRSLRQIINQCLLQ